MRVLYYEPFAGGHRADYVASVVRHLRANPQATELVIAAPESLRAELPEDVLADLDGIETPCSWRVIDAPATSGARLRHAVVLARDNLCTSLFFPMIDAFLPHLAIAPDLGDLAISGIYFRPSMHYRHYRDLRDRLAGRAKGWMLRLALRRRHIRHILSLDRNLPGFAMQHYRYGDKITYLPDMAPCAGIETSRPHPSGDRIRFLMFGALQRRKGVLQVLDAVARLAPSSAARLELRLCGKLIEDSDAVHGRIAALRASSGAEIVLDDRYLPLDALSTEMAAADIVLAPYFWHKGSSGVLYWAAAFGKPVIAQDYGAMGEEVRTFGLGLTVACGDAGALAQAIETALGGNLPAPDAAMLSRFTAGHDPQTFGRIIVESF